MHVRLPIRGKFLVLHTSYLVLWETGFACYLNRHSLCELGLHYVI